MATHGAMRLLRMADNLSHVLAIEYLMAAQGIDLLAPLATSAPLGRMHAVLRESVPVLGEDRLMAPDIARARALIESGAAERAAGCDALPELDA